MRIFYQSSPARSGSTLLQNALDQDSAFYVTPVSGMLDFVFGAQLNYTNGPRFMAPESQLIEKAFLSFCRRGMEDCFQAITDCPYVWGKSRGRGIHFDLSNTTFGREPIIVCMVRVLHQIVASFEKRFRRNSATHKSIETHGTMEILATLKRASHCSQNISLGLALKRLFGVQRRGFSTKMLFLGYEDLVRPLGNTSVTLAGFSARYDGGAGGVDANPFQLALTPNGSMTVSEGATVGEALTISGSGSLALSDGRILSSKYTISNIIGSGTAQRISSTISSSQILGLTAVAITGNCAPLAGLPTIPSNNSQLANGAGYVTSSGTASNLALSGTTTLKGTAKVKNGAIIVTETVDTASNVIVFSGADRLVLIPQQKGPLNGILYYWYPAAIARFATHGL